MLEEGISYLTSPIQLKIPARWNKSVHLLVSVSDDEDPIKIWYQFNLENWYFRLNSFGVLSYHNNQVYFIKFCPYFCCIKIYACSFVHSLSWYLKCVEFCFQYIRMLWLTFRRANKRAASWEANHMSEWHRESLCHSNHSLRLSLVKTNQELRKCCATWLKCDQQSELKY